MSTKDALNRQRSSLLRSIERTLEGPMIFLGFVWLALLIIELLWGLTGVLELASTIIWVIFIFDFLLKLVIAPDKSKFFKTQWLTLISLFIPALRIFRALRFLRLARGLRSIRLVKILASLNRGMRSLSATMQRRGFTYIFLLTLVVLFAGAAGMYAFERENGGLRNYGHALWWTAMLLITVGTDFWPQSAEGRMLSFLLALYGFSIFGYITATLASFFIGRDAEEKEAPIAGAQEVSELRKEIRELKQSIEQLTLTVQQNQPPRSR